MSKFVLTDHAMLDVQQIWNYIAEENINAADKVNDELYEAIQKFSQMPDMGHQ